MKEQRVFFNQKFILVTGSLLLIIGLLAWFGADVVPPKNLTRSRITSLKQRILEFSQQNNRLPSSLAELPERPDYNNSLLDSWERPIQYSSNTNSVVILKSFGKDNRQGGSGEDEDIEISFQVRN